MDLRTAVKNGLRVCGHALVSTVHERLNGIERALQDILEQNTDLASTQTALLRSGVHQVEHLARIRADIEEMEGRIVSLLNECAAKPDIRCLSDAFESARAALVQCSADLAGGLAGVGVEMSGLREALTSDRLSLNDRIDKTRDAEIALLAGGIDRVVNMTETIRHSTGASLSRLEPIAQEIQAFLANESVRQVCIETSDYVSTNPEMGLVEFLYSYVPSRIALDIGGHIGDVSAHLLSIGYDVYAFEPYPDSYRRLRERLGASPRFHSFAFALGSATGEAPLYLAEDRSPDNRYEDPTVFNSLARHGMPEDLPFTGSVTVPVRGLAELHREGVIPPDVGLVKIDTEGFDLEVIRGMQHHRYAVVMVEFWDRNIPFAANGSSYTVETMVAEMRAREYPWYVVIYRVWGQPRTAFYCNHDRAVPGSWGNIIFFRDREIFMEAQRWCSATLHRTYFKHVPAVHDARG